jgi:hypothetical protein
LKYLWPHCRTLLMRNVRDYSEKPDECTEDR